MNNPQQASTAGSATCISREERAELRALRAAAAEGQWAAIQNFHGDNAIAVAGFERSRQIADVLAVGEDYGLANARCIAAAVNALPELLDALDAAETERDALRARLAGEQVNVDEGNER